MKALSTPGVRSAGEQSAAMIEALEAIKRQDERLTEAESIIKVLASCGSPSAIAYLEKYK